jgi:hypothetical protein
MCVGGFQLDKTAAVMAHTEARILCRPIILCAHSPEPYVRYRTDRLTSAEQRSFLNPDDLIMCPPPGACVVGFSWARRRGHRAGGPPLHSIAPTRAVNRAKLIRAARSISKLYRCLTLIGRLSAPFASAQTLAELAAHYDIRVRNDARGSGNLLQTG